MIDGLTIRSAAVGDSEPISKLLGELGYPADVQEIPARLSAITEFHGTLALVAVDASVVAGFVSAHMIPMIHQSEPFAMLTALVTAKTHRGSGIGSLLVSHVERWAVNNGAVRLSLTSGMHREEAHSFYERRSYARTGFRFVKKLDSDLGNER
ncbi:MAG: GNAT family N-acetyltransferase [Gemmatimonadales bacterium]